MSRAAELLVVDDTPANLNVLRAMLEEGGYRVAVAPSGEIALRIASKIKPALILLDVMMPGIDGYETCRRLKANPETQHIPVIFVTARTDTEDVMAGFSAGGVDYVGKPFKREEVLARVRTQAQLHLYAAQLRDEAERFRAIVNNISEALLICDTQTRIRFANPAALHLLQQREDELLRSDLSRVLKLPENAQYASLFDSSGSALYGGMDVTGLRAHGEEFAMDIRMSPLFLQEPLFIAILRDISQQKSTEALLQAQASTDPLTNLGNRRSFDEQLAREVGRSFRLKAALSVLLIDIDHFKAYNDNYGHPQGDRAIIHVARALQAATNRTSDLVARYGGEEFVIVLPETDAIGATKVYEKIAQSLRLDPLLHEHSSCAPHVSISVGIASTPGTIASPAGLLEAADKALYDAKRSGRNRCAVKHLQPAAEDIDPVI